MVATRKRHNGWWLYIPFYNLNVVPRRCYIFRNKLGNSKNKTKNIWNCTPLKILQWSPKAKRAECSLAHLQSLSRVRLFANPRTAARQASLSITNSQSLLKLTSIESVMPSNHLILYRPPLLLPSIFPSIRVFSKWVSSLHQVAKVLEFQLQHQSFQWIFRTDLLQNGLVGSPCSPRDSQESSPTPQFKSIILQRSVFVTLTSIHDSWKNHNFDKTDLCWHSSVSTF